MSRPPNYEFQEWWSKQQKEIFPSERDHLTVDIHSPSHDPTVKNTRHRTYRQLTWLFFLKIQQTAQSFSSIFSSSLSLIRIANRRITSNRTPTDATSPKLYRVIRVFLIFLVSLLVLEIGAYFKGWHFSPPTVRVNPDEVTDFLELCYAYWIDARVRITSSRTPTDATSPKLYQVIRAFLIFLVSLLVLEIGAKFKGWHFSPPRVRVNPDEITDFLELCYAYWIDVRVRYLAPTLQSLTNLCVVLFLVQSIDRVVLVLGCFWIKLRKLRPVANMEFPESGDMNPTDYPMVMVQIPMCNEKEVYQQSIASVCCFDWPKERMLVQILDDSDDQDVQSLIKAEVQKWQQRGIRILYRHRLIRTGYKAGNLKSAMSCDYVKDYEYVAIFDADFQPTPDFLKKTIPYFKGHDDLALVQSRWSFVNKDENLLTRLQNINLSFHFEVEQQVNGMFINFFGFNGTAGVWRIKALEDCGGWLERTTVEDMDIAVRAHLCGWKFIYLNDVKCLCELPESYEAYKKQQYRWHSGPMQLFRLCFMDIVRSKMSVGKKANLIFLFFLLRKLILPFYSFTLFCFILPLSMFLPEAQLPAWLVCYVPGIMSVLNILPAPRSFPFIVPYLLFENTMSVTKFNAMISGLFKFGSSYEWTVTKKLGRSSEADLIGILENEPLIGSNGLQRSSSDSGLAELNKLEMTKKSGKTKRNRIYRTELALAFILLSASVRSLLSAQGIHFYFLLFQGITFLVVGLDLIGEQVS